MKPFPAVFMQPTAVKSRASILLFAVVLLAAAQSLVLLFSAYPFNTPQARTVAYYEELSTRCKNLRTPAGPSATFNPSSRIETGSDRYVDDTPAVVLENARIWTGRQNGSEVLHGSVLLDKGVIVAAGSISPALMQEVQSKGEFKVVDVEGRWVTPGLVDLHSHIGVSSAPGLRGASDGNSRNAPILPWLRSIDGLNTHDMAYELAMAGGVTTAQVLPGSADNIGGQAFVIKLRPTAERSATSKVLEPPSGLFVTPNGTDYIHWRHMKHACGENPNRLYGQTRMDMAWNFRNAYNEARKIRDAQDAFCDKVEVGEWKALKGETFPEDLQWESLVDVLRGRVKLSIHCYEAVDLDVIVRLSNEFKFPVASFHHAGETYLVPDLLKKTWVRLHYLYLRLANLSYSISPQHGGAPSIALFASNFKKKREAYRGSEFAPRILANNSIPVVMKSDHPVLNSRYLLFEAQQAHYYGLNTALALASVTTTPARAAGIGHRVGMISEGYDADVVIWDSHPLTLGATPMQVYIDGIPQLKDPQILSKSRQLQQPPKTPNWDKEAKEAVEYDGVPPLRPLKKIVYGTGAIKLTGVKSMRTRLPSGDIETILDNEENETVVIVRDGKIECVERGERPCASFKGDIQTVMDLQGGSLAPALMTYGSPLGLVEIRLEPSTNDGLVIDPLTGGEVPAIVGNETIIRAVDGLQFETRNALLAYRNGVTHAITAPSSSGFLQGLSTFFRVGASNAMEKGSIFQREAALHVQISPSLPVGVSTQIAVLRSLLFHSTSHVWEQVRANIVPLVVTVDSADIMATLLALKREYQDTSGHNFQMTFASAAESHLLANDIARARVSVILTSSRPYPTRWESRRILPGPPLSRESTLTTLLAKGVNVGIGVVDESAARNTRFELAWAMLESNGTIDKEQAIYLATKNLQHALGIKTRRVDDYDLVIYWGGDIFDFHSKAVGIISKERRSVEIF